MIQDFKKRFWISLLTTLPLFVMAPMIQDILGFRFKFWADQYLQFALATALFFYGGWPFLKGMSDELKSRSPGMMTLIALAISVAYFYSSAVVFFLDGKIFFWELGSLIVIMLLGHWIEMSAVQGASGALQELAKLLPSSAIIITESGDQKEVAIKDLKKGQVVLIRPGEKVPVDGKIIKGQSYVNESLLTGESAPVLKKKGDDVIGGSINKEGSFQVKVSKTGEDSFLSQVIGMVKTAQKSKSKTQNFADKAAGWLFYLALGSGIVTFIVWYLAGEGMETSLERMVTVMIISCPHALGLAIPLVVAISTSVSAKSGLLIRNRNAFENARNVTTVIFDKTGTLTHGEFGVIHYETNSENHSSEDILKLAASIEANSEHPIAAGIRNKSKDEGFNLPEAKNFDSITGKGVKAQLNGETHLLLSPNAAKDKGFELPNFSGNKAATNVYLCKEDELLGFVVLADEIRETSKHAVSALHQMGVNVIMATGDNEEVAKAVSEEIGLDNFRAEVLPEQKQQIIRELQNNGEIVAMTGDGVNDAPALALADIGIAIGTGTDVAVETADIILVDSNPEDVPRLIRFGKKTHRKMIQNLWWAAGYNILAIPLAAGVLSFAGIILSPPVGAALMSLSTIIVAANAQLLKFQID